MRVDCGLLLFVVLCLLLCVDRCALPVVRLHCCVLFVVRWLLAVVCCWLLCVLCCLVPAVVRCSSFDVCRVMFVARLFVVRCSLWVVDCYGLLFVVMVCCLLLCAAVVCCWLVVVLLLLDYVCC